MAILLTLTALWPTHRQNAAAHSSASKWPRWLKIVCEQVYPFGLTCQRRLTSFSQRFARDATAGDRVHCFPVGVLHGLGNFWLISWSAFRTTAYGDAHNAFMMLPAYTRTREGEARQLGSGSKPGRPGVCVRKCPPFR